MQEELYHHPLCQQQPRDQQCYRNITDRGLLLAFMEYISENGLKVPEGLKKVNNPQALVLAALAFLFDANRDEDWVPLIVCPKPDVAEEEVKTPALEHE